MNHATFQAWLDRYVAAWRSMDPAAIGRLFSDDARYFYGPGREPVSGRQAIVDDWSTEPDAPGSWEAEYRPLAIDGETAVATGESRYTDGRTFSNIFVCRFDGSDRCTEFREWFMELPRGLSAVVAIVSAASRRGRRHGPTARPSRSHVDRRRSPRSGSSCRAGTRRPRRSASGDPGRSGSGRRG
jgi:SnoaL-like domain